MSRQLIVYKEPKQEILARVLSDALTPPPELLELLSYRRPHESDSEREFLLRLINMIGPVPGIRADEVGNVFYRVGENPAILWSCHTDSVHHNPGRQQVLQNGHFLSGDGSDVLGADDAAGCWLMMEMIRAGVEGLYIFHRGEEVGGIGSRHFAEHGQDWLQDIRYAVAFDRKGYDSVITHQMGRCCSDDFAQALADLLGSGFKPDDTGLFTDTANYTDVIGECTNISVGYHAAHTNHETLDWGFLVHLRDKLISLDFSSLPIIRAAGEVDPDDHGWGRLTKTGLFDEDWGKWIEREDKPATYRSYSSVEDFVWDNHELIAILLEDMGYDLPALEKLKDDYGL